jgi:hypothetical protein
LITDTGISTYESGSKRSQERSTQAHNTLSIKGSNTADVWRSFRVGTRPKVQVYEDRADLISAAHNGYKKYNLIHKRTFIKEGNTLRIKDEVDTWNPHSLLFLHFHKDVHLTQTAPHVFEAGSVKIKLEGAHQIEVVPYDYCIGFNKI